MKKKVTPFNASAIPPMRIIQLRTLTKQHYLFGMLTGISIFLFFFELGSRSFEVRDVRRFAEIAQEMLQNGNWLIPYKHGEIYMNKPPMFMWLIALFSSIGQHVTPLTARLPGAIAGLASTLITFCFVKKFSSKRTAFIAAVVLATTQRYFWYGRTSLPDMLFTTFIMLALYSFYLGYKQKKAFYIGVHFFTFLATLTKGPLAIIFIFGIIAAFLALQRNLRAMKEMKWRWGIILFITITGLCFAFCLKVGFEPFIATIKREFLTRVNDPITHSEPFYYYFVNIWTDFLPWSLFIPVAVIFAYKKWREGDDFITFTFCWTILIFVFLCTSKAKHPRYMLPLYPAFSIVTASLIADTLKRTVMIFSWLQVSVRWIIFVMAGGGAILLAVVPAYLFTYSWIGIFISLITLIILAGGFLSLRWKTGFANACFAMCMFASIIGWGIYIHCLTVHSKEVTFGTKLTDVIKKGIGDLNVCDIRGYKLGESLWTVINLSLNTNISLIKNINELKTFLNTSERLPVCIIEKNTFLDIKNSLADTTLHTMDICTKKRKVTLIFKRKRQINPAFSSEWQGIEEEGDHR
ncbi:MAG: glycosyltransferase family 39 protein [Candidatus Kuenenia sp.]|nr:glycosyltransferase family 39 protein [Candidatus Kuenenia sp.]